MESNAIRYIAAFCTLAVAAYILLALFQPGLKYQIFEPPADPLDSKPFLRTLETLVDAHVSGNTQIDVLANGENFYAAELEAIKAAQYNINVEAYIFQRGKVTHDLLAALTERARAGVRVNMMVDAVGSMLTAKHDFKELRAAGGRVEWYHPLRWYSWPRYNNRTHRELIVIDGRTGFIGGAGFADHWLYGKGKEPRWRDTMFRVQGEAVSSLQGTFVENWVQAAGEVLTGKEYFPFDSSHGNSTALVINSSPSVGGSTRARILFQTLLASAKKSITITTPYFLPDRGLRTELIKAIKERSVQVRVLTPGAHSDHLFTRRSSRRLYGDLLEAGAKIYEYKPAMIHAKILIVDGVWCVVGSTNLDSRSFGINDEVNLAALDTTLAERLQQDFERDLQESTEVTAEQWKSRSWLEQAQEWMGFLIQRQE